jgi:hypothetical protein
MLNQRLVPVKASHNLLLVLLTQLNDSWRRIAAIKILVQWEVINKVQQADRSIHATISRQRAKWGSGITCEDDRMWEEWEIGLIKRQGAAFQLPLNAQHKKQRRTAERKEAW